MANTPPSKRTKLRVLALVTDAFGSYGGIAQYNCDFLAACAEHRNVEKVHVLPRDASLDIRLELKRVIQHRPKHARLLYSLTAAALAARLRPDIVFSGHVYHGPLAYLIARMSRATLLSQLHGDEVWSPLSRLHIEPLRRSDRVLCVSRDTRDKYVRLLSGSDVGNAVVFPNTVGSDFIPGDRSLARVRYNVSDKVVVLTVARLDARNGYKGHDRIIPLIPSLRANGRDITYLIAGDGPDRPRLEALCRKLSVADCVRFLGRVERTELPDLYRAADLFALPSTGEGFGIAFLEAMACGTPAIGLAVGGAPDALCDGELGLCVSEEEFPEAMDRALSAPTRNGRQLSTAVHDRFGYAAFSARVAQLLALHDEAECETGAS